LGIERRGIEKGMRKKRAGRSVTQEVNRGDRERKDEEVI